MRTAIFRAWRQNTDITTTMPNQEEQGETATRNKPTDKGSDAEEGQDIFKLASENLHLI